MLVATVAGCTTRAAGTPVIGVDPSSTLVDQPVRIRVSGLAAGQDAAVTLTATDYLGSTWRGRATFTADANGVVDLDQAPPDAGSYDAVDGMGLFWSMTNLDGEGQTFFPRLPELAAGYEMRLAVTVDGREVASRSLRREWLAPGVVHRKLRPPVDGLHGDLYLPPAGSAAKTPVLIFGGSEGGNSMVFTAALLASHGHPALSLAYFGVPALPQTLRRIPLEYFADAARLLSSHASATSGPVAVCGYSRGSEAALLLAQHHPDLIRGAVLYAPSDTVRAGFPDATGAAWTSGGRDLPSTGIPVDNVVGPVLAIAGGKDRVWPSAAQAQAIERNLRRAGSASSVRVLVYPDAGHGVGTYPFQPAGVVDVHPVTGHLLESGGSRAADAAARRDSWPEVLALLATLS
ncbi:acyl-CoA thioesterase/bile acid-CoA:amino acid N-acyltransferase family protein [Solwaraspora sp. WMMD1047]|uniref:acyl-CoA thioesterase/bile acid-CoA:amino acid N-acyltransferase family protein n=1 Tax=Solwaraspora sp. WMMD1047 TaxID=3016102 RepID=UPI002417269C|nr:acyl-CoA thioesterase/bile acid-CoA:amino acid N-acyltransferase family protein [Solwaraspora sp. WMMD1047]MDG4832352.1 acyl-CoA thioesterase/bile acid-CoA:amino acid N-acyltransferase family protein [Solwaraspora sp. WMMD1047]